MFNRKFAPNFTTFKSGNNGSGVLTVEYEGVTESCNYICV